MRSRHGAGALSERFAANGSDSEERGGGKGEAEMDFAFRHISAYSHKVRWCHRRHIVEDRRSHRPGAAKIVDIGEVFTPDGKSPCVAESG